MSSPYFQGEVSRRMRILRDRGVFLRSKETANTTYRSGSNSWPHLISLVVSVPPARCEQRIGAPFPWCQELPPDTSNHWIHLPVSSNLNNMMIVKCIIVDYKNQFIIIYCLNPTELVNIFFLIYYKRRTPTASCISFEWTAPSGAECC